MIFFLLELMRHVPINQTSERLHLFLLPVTQTETSAAELQYLGYKLKKHIKYMYINSMDTSSTTGKSDCFGEIVLSRNWGGESTRFGFWCSNVDFDSEAESDENYEN